LILIFDDSTDEDPAMREAIKFVFDKSQHRNFDKSKHRNYRWHITRMRDYELEELYKLH
jgi:hypothetical protein